MLSISCLTVSLTAALTALSPNIWAYAALRFITGMGRANMLTSSIVLATEAVGKRWRDWISILGFFFFAFGFVSLPAMAYLGRHSSWRNLYVWTSVPFLCYTVFIYFLVQESPRWLLVLGRRNEAIEMLKRMAGPNYHVIDSKISDLEITEEKTTADVCSALKILWKKRWAFRRLSTVMIAVFGVGMVYYGMPQNLGNLGSNLYLSVTYNALAEVPAALLTFFLIAQVNRRSSVLAFSGISSVGSILCIFIRDKGWRLTVEVASFFGALTALNVLLIYNIEIFPMCVRNSGISMVRQALMLGAALGPFLVAEARKESFLAFAVFGLVIGCCGLFVACLPETRGRTLTDTIEEEENKEKVSSI